MKSRAFSILSSAIFALALAAHADEFDDYASFHIYGTEPD